MVTIRTKDELFKEESGSFFQKQIENFINDNSFSFNYFVLNISKCKFDGELDPKQPFLRLMSLSHYKNNSIFSIKSNVIVSIIFEN